MTEARMQMHDAAYLARLIGKTENWVKRNAPRLPHHKFGRTYLFSDEDIAQIIRDAARGAAAPDDGDDGELRPSGAQR